ncbi:hypothetical protein KC363_g87 [Hortaea werneckii]|nr:hypothetical protein KC363_g87 [Hortaea werneckii]
MPVGSPPPYQQKVFRKSPKTFSPCKGWTVGSARDDVVLPGAEDPKVLQEATPHLNHSLDGVRKTAQIEPTGAMASMAHVTNLTRVFARIRIPCQLRAADNGRMRFQPPFLLHSPCHVATGLESLKSGPETPTWEQGPKSRARSLVLVRTWQVVDCHHWKTTFQVA